MSRIGLSIVLILGVLVPNGAAHAIQLSDGVLQAPFGAPLRRGAPGVFLQSERPTAHYNRLAKVDAQGHGADCETAFYAAAKALSALAAAAGGNGVVEARSPQAPPRRAPSYLCQDSQAGKSVHLQGTAVVLGGSDAPAARPNSAGTGAPAALPPSPGKPLALIEPDGVRVLGLPADALRLEANRFVGRNSEPSMVRRIRDVDAKGVSKRYCEDALRLALANLQREAERLGAVGVVGVRSVELSPARGAQEFVCEQRRGELTVRLTGVAAAGAL